MTTARPWQGFSNCSDKLTPELHACLLAKKPATPSPAHSKNCWATLSDAPTAGANYTDCDGASVSRGNRLHVVQRNLFTVFSAQR